MSRFLLFKPLPCRTVEKALLNLGFIECMQKGTSHRQFKCYRNGHLFKTTLDCHRGEVSAKNVVSMIKQMGISKKEFYTAIK